MYTCNAPLAHVQRERERETKGERGTPRGYFERHGLLCRLFNTPAFIGPPAPPLQMTLRKKSTPKEWSVGFSLGAKSTSATLFLRTTTDDAVVSGAGKAEKGEGGRC